MTDHAITLDVLLADPSRAAHVPREEAVALLTRLAAVQVALLRAACRPEVEHRAPPGPSEDRLLDVDAAAAMLGVTRRWLYRNSKTLPFTRPISPKIVRFSRAGLVKWLASRRP